MDKTQIVENYVQKLLDQNEDMDMRIMGYIHLYSVAQYARLLAYKRQLDPDLAYIMGLFHDIYTYTKNELSEHAQKGAEITKQALHVLQILREDEVEIITQAIARHSDKSSVDEAFDELLKDADVLAHHLQHPSSILRLKNKSRLHHILKELSIE